jgi:hypothetical protein
VEGLSTIMIIALFNNDFFKYIRNMAMNGRLIMNALKIPSKEAFASNK